MSDFTEVAKIGELKSGAIKAASVGEPQVLLARVGHKYCAVDSLRADVKGNLSQKKLQTQVEGSGKNT
jgi:hypothetical protein